MNINASTGTVRAVTKAFQLAGILDDRCAQPDKARVAAWAEQIERHQLAESDLLDGLQAFYDAPSERVIQIGDLIHHARIVRRDRTDREAAEDQAARIAARGDRVAAEIVGAAAVVWPTTHRTPRLAAAESGLQCATGRHEAMAAIREWTAAKREARTSA